MSWTLVVANPAKKDLRKAPRADRARIEAALKQMADDPFGGDLEKIRSRPGVMRRRIGAWRIFVEIDGLARHVVVLAIKRRTSTTY